MAAKKPLLKHKDWTVEQWYSKVLFTDESKFEIFSGQRRQYVRRLVGERIVEHGGGSVIVWGWFAGDKVGGLVQVEGIVDKKLYHNILQWREKNRGFVFQQSNDPEHRVQILPELHGSQREAAEGTGIHGMASSVTWR